MRDALDPGWHLSCTCYVCHDAWAATHGGQYLGGPQGTFPPDFWPLVFHHKKPGAYLGLVFNFNSILPTVDIRLWRSCCRPVMLFFCQSRAKWYFIHQRILDPVFHIYTVVWNSVILRIQQNAGFIWAPLPNMQIESVPFAEYAEWICAIFRICRMNLCPLPNMQNESVPFSEYAKWICALCRICRMKLCALSGSSTDFHRVYLRNMWNETFASLLNVHNTRNYLKSLSKLYVV